MTQSYYHLDHDGELIAASVAAVNVNSGPVEYFDADPEVKCWWHINTDMRGSGYVMLLEAAALGARPERIAELRKRWGMDGDDIHKFFQRTQFFCEPVEAPPPGLNGFLVYHIKDDEDYKGQRQKGFGATPFEAMVDYMKKGDRATPEYLGRIIWKEGE